MTDIYAQFYPKPRTGEECKKVDCERHNAYMTWSLGNRNLNFCINCKNAHISQYKRKAKAE